MDCQQARDATSLYADGLLSEFERRLLERHLRGCESCHSLAISALASTALRRLGLTEELRPPAPDSPPPSSAEAADMTAPPDPGQQARREASRRPGIGALLAGAEGYEVLSAKGRRLGIVDHLRYRSRLDRPDEIVVTSGRLAWRRLQIVPLDAIEAVDPTEATVILRIADAQTRRLPQP